MNDEIYDDLAIEREIQERFGVHADIAQVIGRELPISRTATATVFLTGRKQLYAYIKGQSKLTLGDVTKAVKRMGLVAELYLPPKNQPGYFDSLARERMQRVFPGRRDFSDDDLRFYRTLAPYNPGLILIHEINGGQIHQFDSDASGGWRPSVKFAYRRIKTS